MQLTAQQQRLAWSDDTAKIVNSILKQYGARNNHDLFQECMATVCRCAQHFDSTRGTKFTTYVFRSVRRTAAVWLKRERKRNELSIVVEDVYGSGEPIGLIPDDRIIALFAVCNSTEKLLLSLIRRGYSIREIQENYPKLSKAKNVLKSVRDKARLL